jgi:DhnA family fructose-bisphosphate aldolase class Ia
MLYANSGKTLRWGRLLNPATDRSVIIAVDHGILGTTPGLVNFERTLRKVLPGGPDGLLISPGMLARHAPLLQGRERPGIVVTLDAFVHATLPNRGQRGEDYRLIAGVEDAVKMGADAVKMVLIFGREQVEVHADNLEEVSRAARLCEAWGIPLMVEPTLWGITVPEAEKNDPDLIGSICRIAVELGADVLKAPYSGSPETFRRIVEASPVPVVILGGPRMNTDLDVLTAVSGAIDAGAIGVAFGRNVFQHDNPTGMVKALRRTVHDRVPPAEALKEAQGS